MDDSPVKERYVSGHQSSTDCVTGLSTIIIIHHECQAIHRVYATVIIICSFIPVDTKSARGWLLSWRDGHLFM